MKETFFNLNEEKQQRIVRAALDEFAVSGYEKTSLDNLIRRAGISKGGLYEYIDSKEDLFQYALEYAYGEMFDFISSHGGDGPMPADPIERTRFISSVAVDFYLAHPAVISFIVKSSQVSQSDIRDRVQAVFNSYFYRLYATCDYEGIGFEPERIIDLLKWLLIKTRNDFHDNMKSIARSGLCRDAYLEEWEFFLSALAKGIYGGVALAAPVQQKE